MAAPSGLALALDDLELEVLVHILEFVDDESRHTSKAVARVNRRLYSAVRLVRYRHATILCDFHFKLEKEVTTMVQNDELLRGLRVLTVRRRNDVYGIDYTTTPYDKYWHHLIDLIGKTSHMKKLMWETNVPIPPDVLLALETHHPTAKLEVLRYKRDLAPSHDLARTEMALASSRALSVFALSIDDRQHTSGSSNHTAAQHVASHAPNLRTVLITSHALVNPAVFGKRQDADHQPNKPNSALRHLTLDGWSVTPPTLDYWAKLVDLSQLETFKCTRGILDQAYFVKAAALLTGLKHLSLNLNPAFCAGDIGPAVDRYIAACSPLESLSIWTWRGNVGLDTILTKHGATLKNLDLHEREENEGTVRQVLTIEELKRVREACPNLNVLTTDLERKSTTMKVADHQQFFDELKKLKLDRLQLYIDIGLKYASIGSGFSRALNVDENEDDDVLVDDDDVEIGEDGSNGSDSAPRANRVRINPPESRKVCGANYVLPARCNPIEISIPDIADMIFGYHTRSTASSHKVTLYPPPSGADVIRFSTELWKYLFGNETTGKRQLDLKFGEWERKAYNPTWFDFPGDLRTWIRIVPHERDDYAAKGRGWVTVRCPRDTLLERFVSD